MNLLPKEILYRRKTLTLCIKLAAIQAVIFLLTILIVWAFDFFIERREGRAAAIALQLQDDRFAASEAVVQAIRDHHTRIAEQEAILKELPIFDTNRLDAVADTLPAGVQLQQIDLDEYGLILTMLTNNLSLIDIHRDAWMATGLVSQAQLTSVTSIADETELQYMLTLHWLNGQGHD